ncbi:MAG: PAS domain S-box protein, partial [Elusimicrobiota bacterium]
MIKKVKATVKSKPQKTVEQKICGFKTRYLELFNNINSGVAVYRCVDDGKDFIFVDFNKAGEKIDGEKKEDLIGKSIFEVRPGIEEFGLLEVFRRVWKTGISEYYPVKKYTDHQLTNYYENFVYRLSSGEIVAVFNNVTEHKQNGEKLQYSANLLENISDALIATDMQYNIQFWNKMAEKQYGWAASEVIGHPMEMFIQNDYIGKSLDIVLQKISQDGCWTGEVTQNRRDGTLMSIMSTVSIVKNDVNRPIGFIAVNRDITERKNMESKLVESELKFRYIAEDIVDVIWVIDLKSMKYSYYSPSITGLLGYALEEAIKMPLEKKLTPESYKKAMVELKKGLEEENVPGMDPNRTRIFEVDEIHKNGSIINVEIKVKFLRNAAGIATSVLGITRDITERKKYEGQKAKIKQKIQQTQRLESLSVLAGGIAHDFNNYLTVIIGNLSLLEESVNQSKENQEILNDAQKATMKAKTLAHQLLIFSKGGVFKKVVFNLKEAVDGMVILLHRTNIEYAVESSGDSLFINADRSQIEQVIENVLINAQQAMPNGGKINIRLGSIINSGMENPLLAEGKYNVLTVEDTGTGIPDTILPQIFDPFFTTKHEGSGLGLAIAYSVIKKYGGEIKVKSIPGEGTTFTILLPAVEEAIEEEVEVESVIPGNGRILVMDDEESILAIAEKMLAKLGYDVVTARNGEQAVEIYKQ